MRLVEQADLGIPRLPLELPEERSGGAHNGVGLAGSLPERIGGRLQPRRVGALHGLSQLLGGDHDALPYGGERLDRLLPLAHDLGEDRAVHLVHRQLGGEADGRRLDRVELLVDHTYGRLLAGEHRGHRVGGEHHDDVDRPSPQLVHGHAFVRREPFRLDPVGQLVGVLADDLLVHAALGRHEGRLERGRLVVVADTEQEQDRERSEDEEADELGLAQDLHQLLAQEAEHLHDGDPQVADHAAFAASARLRRWRSTRRTKTSS